MSKRNQKLRVHETPLLEDHDALGVYLPETHEIHIDPRLKARKYLTILCHELSHALRPNMPERASEEWAENAGEVLSAAIWGKGFRRLAK